ncbi:MAG: FAD-binding protein [Nitrosopumilus sp.]|nr:FAD-binding protein [Nitrosopumilus sp.]
MPENALGTLATEAIRGEGGILLNSKNERFMRKYYPERMELGPRDVVARAIYNEIVEGRGTEHRGVWLDVTHIALEKILDRLPTMYEQFKNIAGIDISKEKMEVGPTAHYSMGGVAVDLKCRTKIKGLFVAGEVISQIHGANRLGGNSLLDTLIFGKIAGGEASKLAKRFKETQEKALSIPSMSVVTHNESEDRFSVIDEPIKFRNEIQELMDSNAGIIRDATNLQKGLERILELKDIFYSQYRVLKKIEMDNFPIEKIVITLEVKSSLVDCEAIIRSALMRQESRGAHFRSDFPKIDNEKWYVNIYCKIEDKDMVLLKQSVKEIKGTLKKIFLDYSKPKHSREFE